MPAIQVARTDTFELQRQKINQIGQQIFNISAGGSDLSTGNLKLGDGTRNSPSLSFVNQDDLGFYRPSISTIGLVSAGKLISDFSLSKNISYQDFSLQKKIVTSQGSSILTSGQNYDPGSYVDIPLLGGTGSEVTSDFTVDVFTGSISTAGENYLPGSYLGKKLIGGTGDDSTVNFSVQGIVGTIASSGSGYIPGQYANVSITGGSGSGALATVNISGTVEYVGTISGGSGYEDGQYPNVILFNPPTTTYTVTSVSNPGTPPPNNVYQIDGITQPVLTLSKGNTYRFDMSDPSNDGHPIIFETSTGGFLNITNFLITSRGTPGTDGAFVDILIRPEAATQTIRYNCLSHNGMGANINIIDGVLGAYGSGIAASLNISNGSVDAVNIFISGENYKVGEVLTAYDEQLGGGSGFSYTITDITYNGIVSDITVTDIGQDYTKNDVISIDNADVGGYGSGFSYTITTDPGIIQNLTFTQKGSGNQDGDILVLPGPVTGVSVTLNGTSNTFIIPDVSTISAGDFVTQTSGSGVLGSGVTVTAVNALQNEITLSSGGTDPGTAVLSFIPSYGIPTVDFEYSVDVIGPVIGFNINNPGNGYSDQDILTVNPSSLVQPIIYSLSVNAVQRVSFTTQIASSVFSAGNFIKKVDGEVLQTSTTVSTAVPAAEGQTYTNISASGGSGSGATFDITRLLGGTIGSIDINNPGVNYVSGNTLIIPGALVGGSTPTDNIVLTVSSVTEEDNNIIYKVYSSGGFITSLICACPNGGDYQSGDVLRKTTSLTTYTVDDASGTKNRYFVDIGDGQGAEIFRDLTLYSGNVYRFDTTNISNHPLRLSKFRDGKWSPSLIEGISGTLTSTSKQVTVSSTTGIFAGMTVTTEAGSDGVLSSTTTYVDQVVNSTTILLTEFPLSSGEATLTFTGNEYTDGVVRSDNYLQITVSDSTPTLYYYCDLHPDMAGEDNEEATISIDLNNPKIFGSGFSLLVSNTTNQDIIFGDIIDGEFSAISFLGQTGSFTDVNSDNLTVENGEITNLETSVISSPSSLSITSATNISNNLSIGTSVQINSGSGNITTSGIVKSNSAFNISDQLLIQNSTLSSFGTYDVNIQPASGRLAKIIGSTALQIPVGSSLERPTSLASNGSIRFNTTTNQYEGYNASTTSWSSLGGVRDIDGNTYILAELTAGANDNTLWFFNDNVNTLKLTGQFLDFRSVKKISSGRLGIPTSTLWTANTPVTLGQYVKYRNNIYEVTVAGVTASSGNEPTHTSGATSNGSAELTWYTLSVSPLEFTEVEEIRVGPNKDCPLVVSAELKLFNKTISTLTDDLIIQPALGKKVVVDSTTHFTIPAGNDNQKSTATAQAGSIRYNTTISQFEGYSGSNWSSLGGVRDVDGNTYIIPETAPGANENILYFYNDNLNTVQLSKTTLDFTNIDTITTSGLGTLALDTPLVTLNLDDTTIDNRDVTRTFISTSKQYLDLGLSSGLVVDPVLRLDDQGDVYLNTGFGTGSFVGVKIFDGDLKEFELADYAVKTSTFSMEKGNSSTTAVLLYALASAKGCQVSVMSKSSTGKKSLATYNVIDNGSDIFHNEFGSLNTSADGFSATFDITPEGESRITLSLSNDHSNGDIVEFTVITQVYK